MAGTARKKSAGSAKKKQPVSIGRELIGLGLGALGVFGVFTVFSRSTGLLGEGLYKLFFGVFGGMAYLVPFVLIAYGLVMMLTRKPKTAPIHRIVLWSLLWLCIVLMMHLPAYNAIGHESWTGGMRSAWVYANQYNSANDARSAGALGALIAYPLVMLLGQTGAWILGIVGVLGSLLGITRISIKELSTRAAQKVGDGLSRGQERLRASRERAAEERARREEKLPAGIHVPVPQNADGIADMADYGLAERSAARRENHLADLSTQRQEKPGGSRRSGASGLIEEPLEGGTAETPQEATPADDGPPWQTPPEKDAAPKIDIITEPEPRKSKKETLREPVTAPGPARPYVFPSLSLLQETVRTQDGKAAREETEANIIKLEETLRSFGVEAKVENVTRGPAITRYELRPAAGVRVSRIAALADDIALNLSAMGVRIEAPIPGKAAVGIEVPNASVATVGVREVFEGGEFERATSKIAAALGKDIAGKSIVADLDRMPHLLIAGATGAGKSVCINTLIASILFKATPDEVRMIMIDPKVVELSVFNGIPHLLIPVVTDPKKAAAALQWAVQEMTERYNRFATFGVRNIRGFNEMIEADVAAMPPDVADGAEAEAGDGAEQPKLEKMPQIVIIIDELADLMIRVGKEVEETICRLAQLGRAAGIHLVIATQRPSVNVITGIIKANIPSRIAFAVASQVDSRTILDMAGAEKLLGRGDMLYYPSGESRPKRVQGAFISDKEVAALVACVKGVGKAEYDIDAIEKIEAMEQSEKAKTPEDDLDTDTDELLAEAISYAIECGQIAVSGLQRRFKIGYARAGRLIDAMEHRKIVEGFTGSKPRKVLITREEFSQMEV